MPCKVWKSVVMATADPDGYQCAQELPPQADFGACKATADRLTAAVAAATAFAAREDKRV